MKVSLSSKLNLDFPKGSQGKDINSHFVNVRSLSDAQVRCLVFIAENNLGAGNWTGGLVYEAEKKVARISYNGRIQLEAEATQ